MNENIPTEGLLKKNNIIKYAPVVFSVVVVVVLFTVIFLNMKPKGTALEAKLDPQEEMKLQEQMAPLIKAGDMKACGQILNDMYQKVCVNNIALQKAEETKDISYCIYIDGTLISKSTCEQQVVLALSEKNGDISACSVASDVVVRKECEDSFPIRMAMKQGSPESCAQATNSAECRDMYFLQKFSADPKSTDCSLFSTSDAQSDCLSLKPLFLSPVPDLTKLAATCQLSKSALFALVCRNLGPGAQGVSL